MELNQQQRNLINEVTRMITDKYEELLWNECYYGSSSLTDDNGDSEEIKDILGQLQSENVEVNFSVQLTPYDSMN